MDDAEYMRVIRLAHRVAEWGPLAGVGRADLEYALGVYRGWRRMLDREIEALLDGPVITPVGRVIRAADGLPPLEAAAAANDRVVRAMEAALAATVWG